MVAEEEETGPPHPTRREVTADGEAPSRDAVMLAGPLRNGLAAPDTLPCGQLVEVLVAVTPMDLSLPLALPWAIPEGGL